MTTIIEIIAIFFTLITIILAINNHKLQKIIAHEDGVFRNPNLKIGIYDTA